MTRSGKGEMFVFPIIDILSRAEEKASLVITDPKLELYKSSFQTLKKSRIRYLAIKFNRS